MLWKGYIKSGYSWFLLFRPFFQADDFLTISTLLSLALWMTKKYRNGKEHGNSGIKLGLHLCLNQLLITNNDPGKILLILHDANDSTHLWWQRQQEWHDIEFPIKDSLHLSLSIVTIFSWQDYYSWVCMMHKCHISMIVARNKVC